MMIRRIVTSSIQNGTKTLKESPARYLTSRAAGVSTILLPHHRYARNYSHCRTIQLSTTMIQLLRSPSRQLHTAWFSNSTTLENEEDLDDDDDDDDDDVESERSPPIDPTVPAKFAVVHHGAAYQKAMDGLHGQQLAIAQLEGEGKDEPDFDPFLEEELEEARLIYEEEKLKQQEKEAKEEAAKAKTTPSSNKTDKVDDQTQKSTEEIEDEERVDEEVMDPSSPRYQYKLFRQKYNNDGSLKRTKSETAILRAGAPSGGRVAVVALAGTQFKVTTDDVLIVNLLKPVQHYKVGSIHTLTDQQVLLVSSSTMTLVGLPFVKGAEVDVMVEEITRDVKLIIFKKRRRKNSQRKTGFRRDVTMLRILDIRFPDPYDTHEHTPRPEPAPIIRNIR